MIISKTPFRISLVGGGTDFRDYYRVTPGGVVGMAIDRYMYVTINKRFDDSIRVSYTKTEIVQHIDDLQHGLIREAMKKVGITKGIEITTIADIPSGTGLGSSSTLTVGVLNALHAYRGRHASAETLAREACEIEIDILKRPIGKQDQYLAAHGGFQHVRFHADETVDVNPIICSPATRKRLIDSLMIFYTGVQRDSASVLRQAKKRIASNGHTKVALDGLVELVDEMKAMLVRDQVKGIGELIDRGWTLKKEMASKVTNSALDRYYAMGRRAGAEGGKILGAGGGGCLLLYTSNGNRVRVCKSMEGSGLRQIPFTCEPQGSKIIYVGG